MPLSNIIFFTAPSGRSPVQEFLDGLRGTDRAAIAAAIAAFAQEFPQVETVTIKHLAGKLWEMKVGGFRVLYGVSPDALLVVHMFAKKTQKTPSQELALAAKRLKWMTTE